MPANLLFILSGSIAAYKACDAISQLVQRGHRVRTVATSAALRFVGAATLEGLTRQPVASDLFASGAALDHIELTRWADATILCPATAHTLNRVAAGLGDDLAGALLLAHDWKKPLLIAPAMNPAMWSHPATAASLEKLRAWGVRFIPVGEGRTACGEVGEGRLAEPAAIVTAIEAALPAAGENPSAVTPPPRLRVLITSGGTAEPIDGVRVLTNLSTGATGALMADHFAQAGHDVTLVRAQHAVAATAPVHEERFRSFADLGAILHRLLRESDFDAVIHAAAVSDFSPELVPDDGHAPLAARGKIDSSAPRLLRLRPNPKLLDTLRGASRNPRIQIVAFKLTDQAGTDEIALEVRQLFERAKPDLVVHNDLSRRGAAAFPATIHHPNQTATLCASRRDLAVELEWILAQRHQSFSPA